MPMQARLNLERESDNHLWFECGYHRCCLLSLSGNEREEGNRRKFANKLFVVGCLAEYMTSCTVTTESRFRPKRNHRRVTAWHVVLFPILCRMFGLFSTKAMKDVHDESVDQIIITMDIWFKALLFILLVHFVFNRPTARKNTFIRSPFVRGVTFLTEEEARSLW